MDRRNWATGLVLAAGGLSLGAGPVAHANDWQFNPRVELGGKSDDNYRLNLPGPAVDSVTGGYANVALQFRDAGQINDLSLTPAVHAAYFKTGSPDNSTDPSVDLDFTHRGLTGTGGFTASWSKETVALTDRLSTDTTGVVLGTPLAGDSGYLLIHDRRQLAEFAPNFSYDLTQRTHLQVTADYINIKYDRDVPGFYGGYTAIAATAGVAQDISQITSLTLRGRYARYEPTGAFSPTNSYGLEGEWDRHVSQVAQAYLRLGATRTDFGSVGNARTGSVTNLAAGGGMNWTFQVTQLFLDVTRSVNPNPTGYSVLRDQLHLRVDRSLTQKFDLIVGARALRDNATGTAPGFRERTYGIGTLGFRWRYLQAWSLAGEYDYTRQKYSGDPTNAVSNAGTLSVIYEPNYLRQARR